MKYDSKADTLLHIKRVAQLMTQAAQQLLDRAMIHDDSKLISPEKEIFDEMTPKLKGMTYGSNEYKQSLKELGVALDHHYAHNPHHPEYHAKGIDGMDLFDIMEMLFDWLAATERHADGNIFKSLEINKKRFGISTQLSKILTNTIIMYNYREKDGKKND